MRAGLTALVVAGGAAAVLGAASLVGPPQSVVEEHPEVQEPVVRTSLVCPYVGGEAEGRSQIGVYALPDVPVVDEEEEPSPITARGLEFAPEPGEEPESPGETPPAEPILSLEKRGALSIKRVKTDEATSVAVEGDGSLAPGLTAEQSMLMQEIDQRGLSTASCGPAAREHWFVGGSGLVGQRGRLVLANPTSVAAVVDVELWDEAGPIDAPATQGIGVPARSQHVLLVDALAPESERVGLRVSTTQGRVSAALEVRETEETTPLGISYIPAAVAPQNTVVIPGVPGHGNRVLRILAPGEVDAIVSVRLFGPNGPYTPVDTEVVTVPSGSVHEVPLEGIGDEPVTIELASDEPITASVRVVDNPDDGLPDVAFTAATPPLKGATTALLGRASDGFDTTLFVSSVTQTAGRVTIKALGDDGVVDEQAVDIPPGSTVPVELESAGDSAFTAVIVEPAQPDTIAVAREITAKDDDGAYLDLLPLISPAVEVGVPRVVGELPGVLDRTAD